jgi:shikimate kinase
MNRKHRDINISLIGFMATGKTTVGRALARRLKLKFEDLDREIERREGKTVSEIFQDHGEPYFRRREREAVRSFSKRRGCVLAPGGGVVLSPENVRRLKAMGPVIELRSSPAAILKRAQESGKRPLLAKNPKAEIRRLLAARAPLYAKAADAVVDATDEDVGRIVGEIVEILRR